MVENTCFATKIMISLSDKLIPAVLMIYAIGYCQAFVSGYFKNNKIKKVRAKASKKVIKEKNLVMGHV